MDKIRIRRINWQLFVNYTFPFVCFTFFENFETLRMHLLVVKFNCYKSKRNLTHLPNRCFEQRQPNRTLKYRHFTLLSISFNPCLFEILLLLCRSHILYYFLYHKLLTSILIKVKYLEILWDFGDTKFPNFWFISLQYKSQYSISSIQVS